MSKIEDQIKELIGNDELSFEADGKIQERLNYHMQLKAASSKVKRNSIIPVFSGILLTKLLGMKVSLLALLFFFFIGYREFSRPSSSFPVADSISVADPIDTVGTFLVDDSLNVY